MTAGLATSPGFVDAARESQAVFRAVMSALARPTTRQALSVSVRPPAPLTPEIAAIALALADNDAAIWLDAPLAANPAVSAYLRFHTGAPIVANPNEAAFALVADPASLPTFESFAIGSEEYPDRSTTIIMAVNGFEDGDGFTVEGPGLAAPASIAPRPLPPNFSAYLEANRSLFPRGVDFVFTALGLVAALPRSSRLSGRA